ncbi:MAG: hypothetical protein ABSC54_11320, partial [Smithellaceae bacterium]
MKSKEKLDTQLAQAQDATPPEPTKEPPHAAPPQPAADTKTITNRDLIESMVAGFGPEGTEDKKSLVKANVRQYLTQI